MTRNILIGVLVCLLHLHVFAGTTGKIAGEVKDAQTGEALVGASVVIEGTAMGAATNIDGYYVILNIPPGKYNVVCSAVGYTRKLTSGVSVSVDLTTTIDIKISSSVVEAEEVVVTAERRVLKKDLTSSEARVDADQIKSLPAREVSDVLSLQAGVTVSPGGGIHMRGGRTSEVAYWVDGVSVSDRYDGSQAVQVDNSGVQELQVISGTFNAEYGQAMSGIVNIVTKDGDQTIRGSLSGYLGDYLTSDPMYYNLGTFRPMATKNIEGSVSGPIPIADGITFYASGRYFKTDGWLFADRTFNTFGGLAAGADSIKDAAGNLLYVQPANDAVAMNGRERISGQAKLAFQLGGAMKLSFTGLFSRVNYRDYNHDWKFLPDGDVRKYDRGYNGSALLTHSLSASSFYTVNASYFFKRYREFLYENPLDPAYNMDPAATNRGISEFIRAGNNTHHFTRSTETRGVKADYIDQISRLHQIKVGVEAKIHRLYLEDYSVAPLQDTVLSGSSLLPVYRPSIPAAGSPLYQEYTEKPIELSAYLQDKLEYERMVVNIGVRVDYFNSRGKILADPQDPNVYLPQKAENQGLTLDQRMAKWYKNASAKAYISPRFGISYPITDKGIMHFSYGHFLQIPPFEFLYQNPGYKVNAVDPIQGVYGNANLNPQRTVMYELGLQQQVAEDLSLDLTGYYRDVRDWVQSGPGIPVRDATGQTATTFYTIFINKDYSNSRGITLSISKRPSDWWSFNLAYTFQTAEGSNSNPDEEQGALIANREPAKALTSLEWDQTHTVNVALGIGPQDWGVQILGRFGSGLPYTPSVNQAESRGEDASRVVTRNSRRKPETYTVDLRAFKNFSYAGVNMSLFLRVFNLFDRRNEMTVYGQTGRATATLAQLGQETISGTGRVNTPATYIVRPDFYSEPREFQFGVDINF